MSKKFIVGDRVKVTSGNYAYFVGTVSAILDNYVSVNLGDGYGHMAFDDDELDFLENKNPAVAASDDVNQPKHYTSHPSGTECIEIVEHMNFCLGNAIKYIWRAGLKTHDPMKDLRKAKWYVEREIKRLEKQGVK